MPTWPTALPKFSADSWKEEWSDGVIRTATETGPQKSRRRWSASVVDVEGSTVMTHVEFSILESFYATDTAYGMLGFDMVHPRTQSSISGVKFAGRYTFSLIGDGRYLVTCKFQYVG